MMNAASPVRACTLADVPVVTDILARAFQDDPAMTWIWPDAAQRSRRLPRFFDLITHTDVDPAHWHIALDRDGQPAAAALWRRPSRWEVPTRAMLRQLPRLVGTFGRDLPRALRLQGLLDANHMRYRHWYLQFVGCLPRSQGQGLGGAVIRAGLARADESGLPAYLETATPDNVGLYQALGFDIIKTYGMTGGPDFWSMCRPAPGKDHASHAH
ncbi:GNAT family N-acetyltransferase [Sandarakinorhabdus sp.]|uniref:GNAT family N-acetyltransferase n=1 Tax=Sandarakinorhabdus sp. TaxID=1916663 RepID=UPI00286E1310|nr:GNAT family N-acetyltransferase [Sandarakinorhabdus sp.]